MRRQRRAYTILEILMLLVVLAAVGALVIPAAVRASGQPALRAAANALAADLEYAQAECIATPSALRVVRFDVDGNRYWIAPAAATDAAITHPADGKPYLNDFATGRNMKFAGVTIKNVTFGGTSTTLAFDAYGRPAGYAADPRIVLQADDLTLTIRVDRETGDIAIE